MGRRSFPYDAYKWQKLSWHAGRLDAAALQRAADESLLYRQVEAAVAANMGQDRANMGQNRANIGQHRANIGPR